MARNCLGGFYLPRKPLPLCVREEIVDLYINEVGISEITPNTKEQFAKGAVRKVVQHFTLHSITQPFSCEGCEPILIEDDILEVILNLEASKDKS